MSFKPASRPENDSKRVEAVVRTGVLDINAAKLYEIYCDLAVEITGCPTSWTGVIDTDRQFALARVGFPEDMPMEVPRNQTLCQFALEVGKPLIISDMRKDDRFKFHPVVTDRGVKFYAAFPIITSDGYMLGTLCVSDVKVRKLSNAKIKLLTNLAEKLAYQLEVQVAQRKSTAESTINIMYKLMSNFSDLSIKNGISVLKFMINDVITSSEKKMLVELGVAINVNNNIEISKSGKKLQEELDMNVGTLKKIKNLSNNEDELMKLLGQIKG
ncbi:GAF domain-containing protein [Alphaproteobacteria bacterium]|nr:GAF domain-containing protein [Alphaproteobacteria bacterium]